MQVQGGEDTTNPSKLPMMMSTAMVSTSCD